MKGFNLLGLNKKLLLVLLLLVIAEPSCDGFNMEPEAAAFDECHPRREALKMGLARFGEHIWDGLISLMLFGLELSSVRSLESSSIEIITSG